MLKSFSFFYRQVRHVLNRIIWVCIALLLALIHLMTHSTVAFALESWGKGYGTAVYVDDKVDIPNETIVGEGYHQYWQYWSQGASSYPDFRSSGCFMTAQAKMLAEMGVASTDPTVFNPDIYWDWHKKEYVDGAIKYAKSKGYTITKKTVELSGNLSQDNKTIMQYINSGNYCILNGGNLHHYAYIGRAASIRHGQAIVLNSGSDSSAAGGYCHTFIGYTATTFANLNVYTLMDSEITYSDPTFENNTVSNIT